MRIRVNGSLSHSTAITMANSALVSRKAAAGAIGAWLHTQSIRRYDVAEATAAGAPMRQAPRSCFQGDPSWRRPQHLANAVVSETTKPQAPGEPAPPTAPATQMKEDAV